jgi:DNA polymerase-3 subunit epsilon
LNKDSYKEIVKEAAVKENSRSMAPKLLSMIDELPSKTGVFYIHNSSNILYIGKGKSIKKAVNQLFLRTSKRAIFLQKEVVSVTYEETGNQLIAELKHAEELKINQPKYNLSTKNKFTQISFSNANLVVVDKGRSLGEKSAVLIENNELKGFCFTHLGYQLNNIEILRCMISPMENSTQNRAIIKQYLQKNNVEKLIRF